MRRIACILLSLLLLCAACASAPAEDPTADTVQAIIEAMNAEDEEALLSLFSEATRQTTGLEDAVVRGLADFTDTLESFQRIGSETDAYNVGGCTLYLTMSHYDLQGKDAHYTLFVALWHADGEVGYPNSVEMGVRTVLLFEDEDLDTDYNNMPDEALNRGGFEYRPSRIYDTYTSFSGAFRVEDEAGKVWLTNEHVQSAEAQWYAGSDMVPCPVVQLSFTAEGTALFEEATRRNLYQTLPMYIGDEPVAAPTVQAVISDGLVMLSGDTLFPTYADAEDLAVYFNTYEEVNGNG